MLTVVTMLEWIPLSSPALPCAQTSSSYFLLLTSLFFHPSQTSLLLLDHIYFLYSKSFIVTMQRMTQLLHQYNLTQYLNSR